MAGSSNAGDIEWLLQGTLYPDVVSNLGVDIPLLGLNHEFKTCLGSLDMWQDLIYAQIESISFKGVSRLHRFSCLCGNTSL